MTDEEYDDAEQYGIDNGELTEEEEAEIDAICDAGNNGTVY